MSLGAGSVFSLQWLSDALSGQLKLESAFPWYVSITSLIGPVKLVVKGRANLLQPALLRHAKKLGVFLSAYSEGQCIFRESFSPIELVNNPAAKKALKTTSSTHSKGGALTSNNIKMIIFTYMRLYYMCKCEYKYLRVVQKEFRGIFVKILGITNPGVMLFPNLIPHPLPTIP